MRTVYDFTVKDRKGKDVSLKEYANEVLLIVNTATKCGFTPQYDELEKLYEKYHAQGFEILGVSLDNQEDDWKKALEDLGMTWPQISDLKGWECEGAQIYSVRAIPATVLIKDGTIVARDLRGDKLAGKVEELLK